MEVPRWLQGGPEPSTVSETIFRADRLKTMRMRLSAAYKGVNALLMKEGAQDFRSGQKFDHTVFFGENVDIHHIFPQDWCKKQGIKPEVYDSIINKTPLSFRTNRIIGGVAPSEYLAKLEKGRQTDARLSSENGWMPISVRTSSIPPSVRSDNFDAFMADRQMRLLRLIEQATGNRSPNWPLLARQAVGVRRRTGAPPLGGKSCRPLKLSTGRAARIPNNSSA
jgi:hypothetical protein